MTKVKVKSKFVVLYFLLRSLRILVFLVLPACGLDGCGANIPSIVHLHSAIPSKESASGKQYIDREDQINKFYRILNTPLARIKLK